jgi:2-polyprenyl-6-methoxyphenol hydroxylase-like FAD-dependent oxidoreductase
MSRKIAIVGAGQAGLQLGFALLEEGYGVTMVTDKPAQEIAASQLWGTPALFWRGQEFERALGIDFWDGEVFPNKRVEIDIRGEQGERQVTIAGEFTHGAAKLVDLRLKYPKWLAEFSHRGGNVVIGRVDIAGLDALAAEHDLLFIATGRSGGSLFERDTERSIWPNALRRLRAVVLAGPEVHHWSFSFIPGVGEVCAAPGLGLGGRPAHAILLWATQGGPIDFPDGLDGPQVLAGLKAALRAYKQDHYDKIADSELLDGKSWLAGAVAPTVRKPVARLPSGRFAVALGDVLITVDPITGQGLNNAAYAADLFGRRIVAHGDQPFDEAWAEATADEFWDFARHSYLLQRSLLEPPEYQGAVFPAAAQHRGLANELIGTFPDPATSTWLHDAEALNAKIAEYVPNALEAARAAAE